MSVRNLAGTTAIVTGASRGFGRASAIALVERGAHVVGVARDESLLCELREKLGDAFTPELADVADPELPVRLISEYRPKTLVLNAGATPPVARLQDQTWQNFSTNWNVDVRQVFNFARQALIAPLDPGSVVVSLSSGAALRGGSPLSGGYAGAKATIRFISAYARSDAEASGSGIRFVALLPRLTPATDLGRIYTEAESGSRVALAGPSLSVDQVGTSVADLATDDACVAAAYLLTAACLQPLE
jgi:NAD(P)-dependent dehydrogenase (short-subunit alcohol dehydrogenase family)